MANFLANTLWRSICIACLLVMVGGGVLFVILPPFYMADTHDYSVWWYPLAGLVGVSLLWEAFMWAAGKIE